MQTNKIKKALDNGYHCVFRFYFDTSKDHIDDITVKPSGFGGVDIYRLGRYTGSRNSVQEFINDYLVKVKWVYPIFINGEAIKCKN